MALPYDFTGSAERRARLSHRHIAVQVEVSHDLPDVVDAEGDGNVRAGDIDNGEGAIRSS